MNNEPSPFNPEYDNDVTRDLAALDENFAEADVSDTEELPNGKYQVRVHAVRLEKTLNGNPILKYDLLVISGPQAGRHLFKNAVLTFKSMPFFKGDLKIMGIELRKLSDLPHRLEDMLDLAIEVTKRTRGEYTNIYFNKLLDIPADDVHSPDGPIPF